MWSIIVIAVPPGNTVRISAEAVSPRETAVACAMRVPR